MIHKVTTLAKSFFFPIELLAVFMHMKQQNPVKKKEEEIETIDPRQTKLLNLVTPGCS